MAITLDELASTPALHLRWVGDADHGTDAPIGWVAVTELENPSPFLTGGEVVLTTGVRQRTGAAQRQFVRRVHDAGALAIGFGTGLSHDRVPSAVAEEANLLGLPLFEVPYATPFIAIGKMVADALSADHYAHLESLLHAQRALASSLLSGGGLVALVQTLASLLSTDLILTQHRARVMDATASGSRLDDCTADEAASGSSQWAKLPISTGMADDTALLLRTPYRDDGVVEYAQSMIGVELRNRAQQRRAQRQVSGQAVSDIVRGALTGQDAVVRLSAIGIHAGGRHRVMLVEADDPGRRILPTLALPGFDHAVTAVISGQLMLALPDDGDAAEQARTLHAYLRSAGIEARIGVGGAYPQANGLRWSFFEAREALSHGLEVNEPERLSLTSLLLSSDDVPLADLADEVLGPLRRYDAEHAADLLHTLQTYLDADGAVSAVAETMSMHRNTVRYRLGQILELTGYDPARTADRVQFWIALSVEQLAGGPTLSVESADR